jgi:hypothetical protein
VGGITFMVRPPAILTANAVAVRTWEKFIK